MFSPETIEWLLELSEPSVRYFTLRDLLDRPEDDPEVRAAKADIMVRGPAVSILSKQQPDGGFTTPEMVEAYGYEVAKTGYQPKKNSIWQLLTLAQLGVDREDARVKRLCEHVLANNYHPDRKVIGINLVRKEGLEFAPLPCFTANMIWSLSTLGYHDDYRVQDSIQWLLQHQRFDDGDFRAPDEWPYRGKKDRCYGRHTCFSSVTRSLKAMTTIPEARRTGEVDAFVEKAVDFVLMHRLYRRNHSDWEPIRPEFKMFTFPVLHYDDVIEIVDTLQSLGVRHEAVDEGLQYILNRQKPDGRWKLDYTLNRSSTYASFGTRGKESKWITLRALKVLKNDGLL
ncbi:nitrogen fixation protein NifH [Methanocella sp. MCL-LM]|uniref:nitrogen fixation protein NifH n=1 Tax=Methanocella sp. MCL-LM TaxID=3412035 RepID=UPI003C74CE28